MIVGEKPTTAWNKLSGQNVPVDPEHGAMTGLEEFHGDKVAP